jgi:hypothetical protein
MWTPEVRNAYYDAVTEEMEVHFGAVEQRCEHLEAMVNSATALLRLIINDFESPYLKPILGAIVERLNSIAAFLEIGLDSAPNPDKYYSDRLLGSSKKIIRQDPKGF